MSPVVVDAQVLELLDRQDRRLAWRPSGRRGTPAPRGTPRTARSGDEVRDCGRIVGPPRLLERREERTDRALGRRERIGAATVAGVGDGVADTCRLGDGSGWVVPRLGRPAGSRRRRARPRTSEATARIGVRSARGGRQSSSSLPPRSP